LLSCCCARATWLLQIKANFKNIHGQLAFEKHSDKESEKERMKTDSLLLCMHCYSAISLKMSAPFSTKKIGKITTQPLCRAVPCCTLASEDGVEGDVHHGERWDTGPGLSSLLEFTSELLWVSQA